MDTSNTSNQMFSSNKTNHTFAEKLIGYDGTRKVFSIDTSKAKYHDIPWNNLGEFGKRKFENIFALTNGGLIKAIYN